MESKKMTDGLRPELFRDVRKPLDQASWLPRQTYVDPEIYGVDMERIFKREWLYATHLGEIPNPGDYTTLTLVEQPLVIVRGSDGAVRCFYNVCRHRGVAIASGCGNTNAFRCPYH